MANAAPVHQTGTDMGAVYILLGCLALSGLVIIAILVYCTSQCWRKRCLKGSGSSHQVNSRVLDSSLRYQKSQKMNGYAVRVEGEDTAALVCAPDNTRDWLSVLQEPSAPSVDHGYMRYFDPANSAAGASDGVGSGEGGGESNGALYPVHYSVGYEKSHLSCLRGMLTFALRYDYVHRVLMLHLIRAAHLPSKDKNTNPDPYVKIYLLPDRKNSCKTRIHRKTLAPEFNEMFSFSATYASLSTRMLQLTVYDFDRFTRHDLIGNVIMRDLFEKSDLYIWTEYTMHIIASNDKQDYGDLLLYSSYNTQDEKLTVTVGKAYNLRPMDITGASDPYVKIYQLNHRRRVRKKKTSIKRANLNPVYNEALTFDIPTDALDLTHLLIKVMDWDRIGSDDLLGCVVLGPESPTENGRAQWTDTVNIRSKTHGYWHALLAEVPPAFSNVTGSGGGADTDR